MKGKIAIVLFSLVLVFGMIAVSCDNGDIPETNTALNQTGPNYTWASDLTGAVWVFYGQTASTAVNDPTSPVLVKGFDNIGTLLTATTSGLVKVDAAAATTVPGLKPYVGLTVIASMAAAPTP